MRSCKCNSVVLTAFLILLAMVFVAPQMSAAASENTPNYEAQCAACHPGGSTMAFREASLLGNAPDNYRSINPMVLTNTMPGVGNGQALIHDIISSNDAAQVKLPTSLMANPFQEYRVIAFNQAGGYNTNTGDLASGNTFPQTLLGGNETMGG